MTSITDRIYIGDNVAVRNESSLNDKGITHIINCALECKNYLIDKFEYVNLNMKDNDSQVSTLLNILDDSYNKILQILEIPNSKIIIHCWSGKSRSGSVLMYYLMKSNNWDYDTTFKFIHTKYPHIKPNIAFQPILRLI